MPVMQKGTGSMTDRLTVEEVEKFDDIHPPTADLRIGDKMVGLGDVCGQLAHTMRENEGLRFMLSECRDNMIKWGKTECDFFRYIGEALSNKESDNGA